MYKMLELNIGADKDITKFLNLQNKDTNKVELYFTSEQHDKFVKFIKEQNPDKPKLNIIDAWDLGYGQFGRVVKSSYLGPWNGCILTKAFGGFLIFIKSNGMIKDTPFRTTWTSDPGFEVEIIPEGEVITLEQQ